MLVLRPGSWRLLLLLSVLASFGCEFQAQAEAFHTARTLKPRAFSIGIEPEFVLQNPVGVELNFHGGMGLVSGLDLGVTYRLPLPNSNLPQSLGLDLEVELVNDTHLSPALSLTLGGHATDWNRYWLDGTLMISKVFRRLEPFAALDCDVSLPPYDVYAAMRLIGGLSIRLSRVTEVIVEGGWGVRNSPSHVSFGLNFYI